MRKAVAYIRCSSEEQADSGLGLEAQRQKIAAYCTIKGWTLVQVYEDAGVSASKPLGTRPAGSRLLADARRSKPIIVVSKMDRAFRSVADACDTIHRLDKLGVAIVSLAENFDTSENNPFAKAMIQITTVFSELERSLIKQRTKEALAVKRKRGERISRHAPYGFDFKDGKLVANVQEQQAIVRIKDIFTHGHSLRKIATTLNAEGIKPKRGDKWVHASVRAVLRRPAV
jgi:DNA invertase Pin-like site-specific DNA recombinase